MDTTQTKPLTEGELDRLSDFLDGSSSMNIEALDGFICALVSSPDLIPPSEYFSEIWSEDHSFADSTQAREMISLLMRHWNTVASALLAPLTESELYLPILNEDENGVPQGNDWAKGFMHGVRMRPASWHDFLHDNDHSNAIMPMMVLDHEHDPDTELRPPPITPGKRKELIRSMVVGLAYIYRHFARRRGAPTVPTASKTTTQTRATAKIGRNDRCPCGSGKKYKQCCGQPHNLH